MARRKRKRRMGFVMMVVIAMLIAGFLARRLMMPGATHYLTYRAPEYPAQAPETGRSQPDDTNASKPSEQHPSEHLTDSDRRALDEVIRRKSGGN
jgi:hypothetical protein